MRTEKLLIFLNVHAIEVKLWCWDLDCNPNLQSRQ